MFIVTQLAPANKSFYNAAILSKLQYLHFHTKKIRAEKKV